MCQHCDERAAGRMARMADLPISFCPHLLGHPLSIAWITGWVNEDEEWIEAKNALIHQSIREGKRV